MRLVERGDGAEDTGVEVRHAGIKYSETRDRYR